MLPTSGELDELKNKSRHLEAEVEKLQHDSRQESI
jgi:cell division protein FtsB